LRFASSSTESAPGDAVPKTGIYGRDPDGNVIELQQTKDTHPLAFENFSIAAERAPEVG